MFNKKYLLSVLCKNEGHGQFLPSDVVKQVKQIKDVDGIILICYYMLGIFIIVVSYYNTILFSIIIYVNYDKICFNCSGFSNCLWPIYIRI